MTDNLPNPESRKETYLAKAAGVTVEELPTPASREELYLNAIAEGGGSGGGSGYEVVDNLPPVSEADDGTFYILPDGSLNYIKNGQWETISATNGDIKWTISGGYYPEYSTTTEVEHSDNCTVNSIDEAKLEEFLTAQGSGSGINFNYQEGYDPETGPTGDYFWTFWGAQGEVLINPSEMESTTGINVTIDDPETPSAYFSLAETFSVNTEIRESLSEHYVSLEDLCGNSEQSIVHLIPMNDGDEYLEIPKGVFNSVAIQNDSPLVPVVTPYEFCNNFTRVDTMSLSEVPIVLGLGNLMNVGVKPEALSPEINMRTPVISGLSSDARVSRYYQEGLSTSDKTIVGAINELVGGGGGGGVTYTFNNTSDGWEVNGSDGSYFSHIDGGGASPEYTITVKWMTGEFQKTHTVTTENCTVTFNDEGDKDKVIGGLETDSGWIAYSTIGGEFDPNSGAYDIVMSVTTTDATKRAMFKVDTQVTYSNPEIHETTYTTTDLWSLTGTDTYSINGEEIPAYAITEIIIATNAKTIDELPGNFCRNLVNLQTLYWKRADGDLYDGDTITVNKTSDGCFSNTKLASGEYSFNGLGYLNILEYGTNCFVGAKGPESYPRYFYVLQGTKAVGRSFCALCNIAPSSRNEQIVLERAYDYLCAGTNIVISNYTFPNLYQVGFYAFAYCTTSTSGGIILPALMSDGVTAIGYGIKSLGSGYVINIPNISAIPRDMCTKAVFSTNQSSFAHIKFNPYMLMSKSVQRCFKDCQGYFGINLSGSGFNYDSEAFSTEDATSLMYTHGVEWSGTATRPTDSNVLPYRKIISA